MTIVHYLETNYQPEENDRQYLIDYVAIVGLLEPIEILGVRTPVVGDTDLSGIQIADAIAVLLFEEMRQPVRFVQIKAIHSCTPEQLAAMQEQALNPIQEDQPMTKFKSLFQSKTVWAILAQFLVAAQPIVAEWGQTGHDLGTGDISRFALLLATAAYGVYGRYAAKTILVTPPALPGRNAPKG